MFRFQPYFYFSCLFIGVILPQISTELTTSDDNCEVCKFNKEIDELKHLLRNCEDELQQYKTKFSAQKEVQSSSALSYFGSIFSGITSPSKRSSPLHSSVSIFLQNLGIDETRSMNEIQDSHDVDVR